MFGSVAPTKKVIPLKLLLHVLHYKPSETCIFLMENQEKRYQAAPHLRRPYSGLTSGMGGIKY